MGGSGTVEGNTNIRNGVKRMIFVILALLLEFLFLLVILHQFNDYAEWISILTRVIAAGFVLMIYAQHKTASIKMPWIILMMAVPVVGLSLYLLIGLDRSTKKMRRRYEEIDEILFPMLPEDPEAEQQLRREDPAGANIAGYLKKFARYPLYRNTDVKYYSEASDGLEAQLQDLRKAEKFIFMEYHAIEDAESFHRIEEVLVEKVHNGVEVRLFYDDLGSIGFINTDFVKRMEAKGIRCRVFNPFAPGQNIFLNYRDHRKITVIDGKIGYTGGYNLANEYFNVTHPYGYWKDTGIRLEGPAVKSLTMSFLEMWTAVNDNDRDDRRFENWMPDPAPVEGAEGYVQPYADSPMDNIHVGEDVYISLAESAQEYIWFVTPYLIITEEMTHALGLAAMRGVDVRVITPGIPDKKLVYGVTRSYYNGLVRNGVRVYEYTPGFSHCKMSVSDDRIATCGTINMDFRSLYHHFENGCVLYHKDAIAEIRKDFENMMSQSREVTEQYRSGRSSMMRFSQMLLRLAAPLL